LEGVKEEDLRHADWRFEHAQRQYNIWKPKQSNVEGVKSGSERLRCGVGYRRRSCNGSNGRIHSQFLMIVEIACLVSHQETRSTGDAFLETDGPHVAVQVSFENHMFVQCGKLDACTRRPARRRIGGLSDKFRTQEQKQTCASECSNSKF
jgi:hypothetical protein